MFEIEEDWTCKAFGVNWLCHHYLASSSQPAFIFTTARLAGKAERLEFDKFEKSEGTSLLLNPSKKVLINNHVWIDSFHQNHFYKNVLSRYERTVCCDDLPEKFQVLVGFHAFRDSYPQYAISFLKAIRSLNLLTSNLEEIRRLLKQQTVKEKQNMNDYIQSILFDSGSDLAPIKEKKSFPVLLLLFGLLVLGGIFFYYRKKTVKKALKSSKLRKRK